MVGGASVHMTKHSFFRLKTTVGCRLCTGFCVVCVMCVVVCVFVCCVLCVCVC